MEGGGGEVEVQDGCRSQKAVGRASSDIKEAILARKQRQWEIEVQIPATWVAGWQIPSLREDPGQEPGLWLLGRLA